MSGWDEEVNTMMGRHLREVACILVYDESCSGKVDWFHTLLNHALVAANTASVASLLLRTEGPGVIEREGGPSGSGPSISSPGIGASTLGFLFGASLARLRLPLAFVARLYLLVCV